MVLRYTFLALALVAPSLAQQPLYAQCGGNGWTGGTTCVGGANCVKLNDWFSQCQPGGSTTTPPVTTTTPPVTTTTPPVTTTPSPTPSSCAPFPNSITLRSVSKLPDPFTDVAGNKVTTKAAWACRQEEISKLFQKYELGTLPPKPSGLTATYSGGTLSITASEGGKSISFSASISGNTGSTSMPAIIGIGGISIPRPAGVAQINFNNDDMAAQANTGSRGQGKFYTLYGSGHSASAMMAWAWGVGRVIDALEITTGHNIDVKKLAVSGCSRNGKGAYIAGAFNPRIWLTIPQESGSGGAGSWRISNAMKSAGIDTQTAQQIITENVWFSKDFEQYVNRVNDLPTDHHLLAGLVAPRPLLIIEASSPDWLGPRSTWGAQNVGRKIYDALGITDYMGVSQAGGHNHCAFPSSQQPELTAFFNRFLKNGNDNTNVLKTDGANQHGYKEADWVDWTTPTLS